MANHGCMTNPCLVCNPHLLAPLADRIQAFLDEDGCPECGDEVYTPRCYTCEPEPERTARPPHPDTMIGRK